MIEAAEENEEADVFEMASRLVSRLPRAHSPALDELISLGWFKKPESAATNS